MDVVVCIGSSCHLKGSRDVIQILERNIALNGLKDQVNLRGSFCMGRCQEGVSITVDGKYFSVSPATTEEFFNREILSTTTACCAAPVWRIARKTPKPLPAAWIR